MENMELEDMTNWLDYSSVSHMFDNVDVIFEFPGRGENQIFYQKVGN